MPRRPWRLQGTRVSRLEQCQLLTKRAERLEQLAPSLPWPSNLRMGVSVETQEYRSRIHALQRVPAAIRFLSLEPLLGPLGPPP